MADLPQGKRTITKNKSEQEVNLRTLLGRAPTEEEKRKFAEKAIERINERTLDGDDIEGSNFTRYSKAYAAKKGVSRDSVDLFLEGDMLGSIKQTGSTRDKIKFGILESEQALKSHGHNTGGGNLPKREFFGITRNEAETIANEIKQAEPPKKGMTLAELRAAVALIGLERDET